MDKLYVPAAGKRIIMPGNQPDWPSEGQKINPRDPYHRMLVRDGDLVEMKPVEAKSTRRKRPADQAETDASTITNPVGRGDASEEG